MKQTILKTAFVNALLTGIYIVLISTFLNHASNLFGPNEPKTVLVPIMMLSLIVFSVALVGLLVFGRPILWYLDGKKQEAVMLVSYTLGIFFLMTLIVIVALLMMPHTTSQTSYLDSANTTYTIEGTKVALVNGKSEVAAAPGSASKITTTIFGKSTEGDLNNDGSPDEAVILVQDGGGSGTFYYIAAAIHGDNGVEGTNAVLLGDRIAPQTIEIKNNQIIANYADRNPGEPMTTKPSVGVSKYLSVENGTLIASSPIADPGEHCGGNMTTAPVCKEGYHCAPNPNSHLPFGDVGGFCVAN